MRVSFKEKLNKVLSFFGISIGTLTTMASFDVGPEPLIASVIAYGIGIFTYKNGQRLQRKREDLSVLRYLMTHRGVSLTEIIVDLDIPIDTGAKIMERLQQHSLVRLHVSESGDMLYSIADGYELKKIISETIY